MRIAGCIWKKFVEPDAISNVHRCASGIPRVINLLCEHCLVSAFVDQQKVIGPDVVDVVARDFDLGDNNASAAMTAPAASAGPGKFDLVDALRSLAVLADRLRQTEEQEKDLPDERKL